MNDKSKTPVNPAWGRVADALQQARLRAGFVYRTELVAELVQSGRAKLSVDRILGDLERGSRTNYSPATLTAVESWYGLPSGEIQRLLGTEAGRGTANPRKLAAVRAPKISRGDGGASALARLGNERLVEIVTAIAQELADRSLSIEDNPMRLIPVVRPDLDDDLWVLNEELD